MTIQASNGYNNRTSIFL